MVIDSDILSTLLKTVALGLNYNSNALANIARRLIGQHKKIATVYSAKLTFGAKHCVFGLVKVKKYIRMGITLFKIFIWGGKLCEIQLRVMLYC